MRTLRLLMLLVLLALAGCAGGTSGGVSAPNAELIRRIDASLGRASQWMIARQSPDGAWRSEVYGFMKDGPSLTPHVVSCIYFLPAGDDAAADATRRAFDRGIDYLIALTRDGEVRGDVELIYPVYTAAESARMILKGGRDQRHLLAHAAWRDLLRNHQLTEDLGWRESDLEYGGWSYALVPPRRPAPGAQRGPWDWSNLSATIYGVAALRAAKVPMTDAAYAKALLFVMRCQNFAPELADDPGNDGGFFFSAAEELRNKAGVLRREPKGAVRYRSYGSMTVDGLRAMLVLGLPPDHPRVAAARQWLERHFSPDHNPGDFAPANEDIRDATYYYYCWGLAHAFLHLRVREVETSRGRVDWVVELAEALLKRQRADGSWVNNSTDAREDDPMVSTPFAASALAICRRLIAGQSDPKSRACIPGEMLGAK